MNELMIFEGNEVEVFEYEGKILFNPKHVGKCLELTESAILQQIKRMNNKQVIKLSNKDISKSTNCTFRKLHNTGENFITESGVYKMIFASRSEGAERFQDWVTDEVLPTLRKTGSYSMTDTNELTVVAQQFMDMITTQQRQLEEQQNQINEIKSLVGIRAKQTFNYTQIIKRHLGIDVINDDYKNIRDMFFFELGISKWEDLDYSREHVIRLIEICNQYKKPQQISFFEDDENA